MDFKKKLEVFYLATEFSISKALKSVANTFNDRNRDSKFSCWSKNRSLMRFSDKNTDRKINR